VNKEMLCICNIPYAETGGSFSLWKYVYSVGKINVALWWNHRGLGEFFRSPKIEKLPMSGPLVIEEKVTVAILADAGNCFFLMRDNMFMVML
jgi:hypothetical protein